MKDTLENFKKYPNLKVIYFLSSAALACIQPFISVYLHSFKTIKPSVIGIITCIIPFLSFVSAPIWTGIADKHNVQKRVLVFNCLVASVALLLLIPTNDNLFGIFALISLYSISSAPITPLIDGFVLKEMGEDSKLYGMQRLFAAISYGLAAFATGIVIEKHSINFLFVSYTFWMVIFLIYFIYNQTNIASKIKKSGVNLSNFKKLLEEEEVEINNNNNNNINDINNNENDSGCTQNDIDSPTLVVKAKDQPEEINDVKDNLIEKEGDYEDLASIPMQANGGEHIPQERLRTKQVYLNILKDAHMMIFLFATMICGMTANIIGNFLFLFLQDVKHASSMLLGSTMPFTVVMELPFFFFGKQLLTVVGVNKLIIIGHCAFILRLCLYNILAIESVSPWFVLPIEILHGIAFATIWTAGVELSNQMAPKGYETTYQGIFAGMFVGLGAGLGSIIGGFLYEHKSPMYLFRFTAIATTFSLIVFSLNQLYFSKKNKKKLVTSNNSLI
ncbi:hypothetical protein DICPUDRAFT_151555 [Dictyostelium purpureum]|uniref:Major facilitator superfamily associated domain-containing protein n=1 Tax=Dictyostelium purpureum TaxID=5786 RepID=F0ZJ52_DICPU|nr:uncharacterized protein DICPUDRAFT_151555 [Dictyostelium purpureum]EGC36015.1 hypothetical protein DICPUDRAFT_151555 [Dictyostelium purpureum]|eukprot:XP_003287453.1 hypothetical protein DICPUDRAFT_151555 [Dictyostelium purpureum]